MTSLADAREFLVELISQLFHADVLITEQAERIGALEAESERLRAALAEPSEAAASAAPPLALTLGANPFAALPPGGRVDHHGDAGNQWEG
jgi:hypothetical protein